MNLYKKIIIFNAIVLILSLILGGWIYFQFYKFVNTPASLEKEKVYMDIQKGESLYSIIKKLKKEGVISRSDWFYYYIKIKGCAKNIKAGTHFFYKNYTPKEVLKELLSVSIYTVKVRVREGFNIKDIAKMLEKSGYDANQFLLLCNDASFASNLTGVDVTTLEGFLYPDTYYFEKHEKIKKIIDVMFDRFKNVFHKITNRDNITEEDYKKIIIASIIEKETSVKDDMPIVASVIYNRLKKGMLLQMDSTVIYGIKYFDGNLKRVDLRNRDNIYNTYVYKGLPKTPICNPSIYALQAAYYPKKTDYLYFVSKDGKRTIFSKTLKEHNRWVRKYQKK